LLPGDARHLSSLNLGIEVSIRARHCCRAMQHKSSTIDRGHKFQSAPGIAAGRCVRTTEKHYAKWVFQSAPGIAAGRCEVCRPHPTRFQGFNPRPALLPGDADFSTLPCVDACSFNPRPALLPGDARQHECARSCDRVSIRARHCCRAMRDAEFMDKAGVLFQSAPGIAAGRCKSKHCRHRLITCFNPRPALLPGDACSDKSLTEVLAVSIRARHCCRAMPCSDRAVQGEHWVSIRARHCCRAMQWCGCSTLSATEFQSAPGIAAGRCLYCHMQVLGQYLFQSAPGIAAGRCG